MNPDIVLPEQPRLVQLWQAAGAMYEGEGKRRKKNGVFCYQQTTNREAIVGIISSLVVWGVIVLGLYCMYRHAHPAPVPPTDVERR